MIKLTSLLILIPIFILGFFLVSRAQNPLKFTYLFRNVILSKSKKFELAPILRGRVYYPRYFYIPSLKQYMVYSSMDKSGPYQIYENQINRGAKTYALLNELGTSLITFETTLRFSYRSGCFYGPHTYIPLLESGKTDTLPYNQIHNKSLDLSGIAFEKLFQELYVTSEYVEFINLRASNDNIHQAGVIFKRQGNVEILLSGLKDSRMISYFQEDLQINNFDDYYKPDIRNKQNFPQSSPAIEMIPLVTNDTNPFLHWRTGLNKTFHIKKYVQSYSSGWNGIMKSGIIPVYVPGESSGTTYVNFKIRGETFKIKLLDVEKANFIPAYHLGLRTFELPANIRTQHSLIFMESVQNSGENRLGGGVFVLRPATTNNPSADIPSDITEKDFNNLPIALQAALLDLENATCLSIYVPKCTLWFPEIERLKNLTKLNYTSSITSLPDAIENFPKLKNLTMKGGKITQITPKLATLKALTHLDISSNPLTEFPKEILELKNLEYLSLNFTSIPSLPSEFSQLKNLKHLDIIETQIKTLPESMINMHNLYIYDAGDLEKKLSDSYKHLFNYTKNLPHNKHK